MDESRRTVFFSTAPGESISAVQRLTVHALDLDTAAVVWQHDAGFPSGDASYSPTSSAGGVVVVGSVIFPHLGLFDAADGTLLYDEVIGNSGTLSGISSGAAIVDGTIVVGTGIGARSSGGSSPGDFAANTPADIVALCVAGTIGCPGPLPKVVPGFADAIEGDVGTTLVRIPVRLSSPSQSAVTVDWRVVLPHELHVAELVDASGIVTFDPGPTKAFADVEVALVDDTVAEWLEYFTVDLIDVEGADVLGPFGVGLIFDLD